MFVVLDMQRGTSPCVRKGAYSSLMIDQFIKCVMFAPKQAD